MLPELRTRRLTLRPFQDDDIDLLHAMWTDPDVRRYLWDDEVISRERVVEVLRSHKDSLAPAGLGYWVVTLNGETAGFCGFRFIDDSSDAELMYGLLPQYWGQGIATEASRAALDYIWKFTAFDQIRARTDPPNTASVAVMERLGMVHLSSTPTMISYIIDRPQRGAIS
jgi:[ribosomal protein S5]-alanine N-acetyltransferase